MYNKSSKNSPSIYWHDYETFGADTRRDRPVQFAGIRTDLDLNIIGEPLVIYCKPADDYIPHPEACLVTGITPQQALQKGIPETEFMQEILDEFSQPN
ncbi:MAG: exonuclease domain-containing protein, partial [Gammaproteobacteria bacterium]|nr:exonuclease domain-containing protein [Gammaproteobacteria bacterium]